jgi:hypothetical protein
VGQKSQENGATLREKNDMNFFEHVVLSKRTSWTVWLFGEGDRIGVCAGQTALFYLETLGIGRRGSNINFVLLNKQE